MMKISKKQCKKIAFIFLFAIVIICYLIYNGFIWFVYPELMGYTVKGIDVARYQGDIDWEEISKQNITFAFIKATEGNDYIDPKFKNNIIRSRDNGIYASAYHFFSSKSKGIEQAENFINNIKSYQLDLPPVLDFEIPATAKNKDKIIKQAKIFLEEVEKYYRIKPIIYTTYESYNNFLTEGFSDYDLWFRDILKKPKITSNRDWIFWQYSNRGRLKGIDKKQKYVDLNVFNGGIDKFNNYLLQQDVQAPDVNELH